MSAEKLYTPKLLAAAMELAHYPPLENAPYTGSARSRSCGSTLEMDLALDAGDAIEAIGMRVRACAIGQASAALFARHAHGHEARVIAAMTAQIEVWLQGAAMPDWPDLDLIAPAAAYPGRHGAILLPWKAAHAALSSAPAAS